MNWTWYKRSIIPPVQEILMRKPSRVVFSTGEVSRVTSKVREKMTRLLARMLNEHLLNLSTLARVVAQKTRATQKR